MVNGMTDLERPPGVLRLLTLNAWFRPPLEERLAEMVAWIDLVSPHLVCLQEVRSLHSEPSAADCLAAECAGNWSVGYGGLPDCDGVLSGNAVMSRWPMEVQGVVGLEGSEARPKLLLATRTGSLDVFCVHLTSDPAGVGLRERQVVAIDEIVASSSSVDSPLPPIVAGDFNASPGADAIRFLRGECSLQGRSTFYQDVWGVAGCGLGLTWSHANPHVPSAYLFDARCDFVFVGVPKVPLSWNAGQDPSGTPVGQVVGAHVVCDRTLTGCFASDHYGVLADIAWPEVPVG